MLIEALVCPCKLSPQHMGLSTLCRSLCLPNGHLDRNIGGPPHNQPNLTFAEPTPSLEVAPRSHIKSRAASSRLTSHWTLKLPRKDHTLRPHLPSWRRRALSPTVRNL